MRRDTVANTDGENSW